MPDDQTSNLFFHHLTCEKRPGKREENGMTGAEEWNH